MIQIKEVREYFFRSLSTYHANIATEEARISDYALGPLLSNELHNQLCILQAFKQFE